MAIHQALDFVSCGGLEEDREQRRPLEIQAFAI
jgi:hypothetical protein